MKDNTKKTTRSIAFCSMLSALSVVIASIGIILPTFDLVAAMLASYFIIIAVCELGRGYAFGVFASSAVLAVIIAPQNSAAIFYSVFMGYYPIIKSFIEIRIRKRFPAILLKILAFNVALAVILFISVKFLSFEEFIGWYAVGLVVLAQLAFILYDMALTKIVFMYYRYIRRRLRVDKFLRR